MVADCVPLRTWVRELLHRAVWPALSTQFGVPPSELWLEDCFVIKYEPTGQPGLGPHRDDSELSFNLLLSEDDSFEGGGTAFADATPHPLTLRPQCGELLSHFGRHMHEGRPVTGGRAPRYVLAGFVRARPLAQLWRELRHADASRACTEEAPEEDGEVDSTSGVEWT